MHTDTDGDAIQRLQLLIQEKFAPNDREQAFELLGQILDDTDPTQQDPDDAEDQGEPDDTGNGATPRLAKVWSLLSEKLHPADANAIYALLAAQVSISGGSRPLGYRLGPVEGSLQGTHADRGPSIAHCKSSVRMRGAFKAEAPQVSARNTREPSVSR